MEDGHEILVMEMNIFGGQQVPDGPFQLFPGTFLCTGEYFTKKSIFCQGPRQQLSFFAEEIFGIFKLKLPYFWTICDKNA